MIRRLRVGIVLMVAAAVILVLPGQSLAGPSSSLLAPTIETVFAKSKRKQKDDVDRLLLEDDSELFEADDDVLPETDESGDDDRAGYRTILLDINSMNADKDSTAKVYRAVFATLSTAADLGEVVGREVLGKGKLTRHVVRTCRGMDNPKCLRSFAQAAESKYAIYGELRDLDDTLLLTLEMMDVEEGKVIESLRRQIDKPALGLAAKSGEAACSLVRLYGCDSAEPAAIAAPVPVAPVAPAGEGRDEESFFREGKEKNPEPEAAPEAVPEKIKEPEPEPQPQQRPAPPVVVDQGPGMDSLEVGGWVMVALAGAALAGAATTTGLMFKAYNEYQDAGPGEGDLARDRKDTAKTMQWTSIGLYGAAAAFGAAGITMVILGRDRGSVNVGHATIAVEPALSPQATGVLIRGRF